jgi:hypothetical protein
MRSLSGQVVRRRGHPFVPGAVGEDLAKCGAPGRPTESEALTPTARRELAGRALLGALDEYLRAVLGGVATASEWIDQHSSPLGKRAHLEAVRRGELKAVKFGRRVLVRRGEMESFLENRPSRRRARDDGSGVGEGRSPDEVAAAVLASVGLRLRKT